MSHEYFLRVYYEDTDLAGIVYYANYLKFIERARSEFLRFQGIDQSGLQQTDGIVFAVRRIEADYHSPAKFDDQLTVQTHIKSVAGARVLLRQLVLRGSEMLFTALVTIVALRADARPARIPANIRQKFAKHVA